jgi:hypothetical protein
MNRLERLLTAARRLRAKPTAVEKCLQMATVVRIWIDNQDRPGWGGWSFLL